MSSYLFVAVLLIIAWFTLDNYWAIRKVAAHVGIPSADLCMLSSNSMSRGSMMRRPRMMMRKSAEAPTVTEKLKDEVAKNDKSWREKRTAIVAMDDTPRSSE